VGAVFSLVVGVLGHGHGCVKKHVYEGVRIHALYCMTMCVQVYVSKYVIKYVCAFECLCVGVCSHKTVQAYALNLVLAYDHSEQYERVPTRRLAETSL